MRMTGERFADLMKDLEAATEEIDALAKRHPAHWERARPGRWTVGQHADHVAVGLACTAESLAANEQKLRAGGLSPRPRRGPLQALFVAVAVGAGKLPRGGKTPPAMLPRPRPDRDDVLVRIARERERLRSMGERLSAADRDRLWMPNPYRDRWHYSFSEALRMNAVHFRHHARQIEEIVRNADTSRG